MFNHKTALHPNGSPALPGIRPFFLHGSLTVTAFSVFHSGNGNSLNDLFLEENIDHQNR